MRRPVLAVLIALLAVQIGADRPLRECLWLDRLPPDAHAPYRAWWFGPEGWGLTVDAQSSYKQTVEIFEFHEDGTEVNFLFHHDDRKPATPYRIEPLQPPTKEFDRQLTLGRDPLNGDRKTTYYTGPGR